PLPPKAWLDMVMLAMLFWVRFMVELAFPEVPGAAPLLPPPLPPIAFWPRVRLPEVDPETAMEAIFASAPFPPFAPMAPVPPAPPLTVAATETVPPPVEVPLMPAPRDPEAPFPPENPAPCACPPAPPVLLTVTLTASGPALEAAAVTVEV